ncbi:HpcH/HpaI aldolase/citrate lyase family protein [Frankineae bacterium MT45]|nr:HpcH/HpaI aldolase/citrate lyase family protein [Frankineae bacterium MT45]
MKLTDDVLKTLDQALADDDATRAQRYPGPPVGRQPVHTAYVPADLFSPQTPVVWGTAALTAMDEHGPLPETEADVERLVRAKLVAEPIEDLRIDFEDGYGLRSDAEEDRDVLTAADSLAQLLSTGGAPPFSGLRMKSFEGTSLRHRGVRTLDAFIGALLDNGGTVPPGFRVTLPKVTSVAQVEAMAVLCDALETAYSIERLRVELQVETPQAILGSDGTALIAPMIQATQGRCIGLHYGTYDYSASVGVAAQFQSMEHSAADYAKSVIQVAAAGTGVAVSDGSTNILPVGDRNAVQAGWRLHSRLVTRSLERAFYQGWDLHPVQLPTRFAATYAFYRRGLAPAGERLRAYLGKSAGGFLDEPATAAALAGYLLRGLDAGAVAEDEVWSSAGVRREELETLLRRGATA